MTEKRFTFEIKTQGNKAYTQWYDNGKPINSAETLCELLNELHEEKEQLKEQWKEKRHEDINELSVIAMRYKALEKENERLKKALWCIRKRYGYTVEEFIEDLKDNGIDLTKVDLE